MADRDIIFVYGEDWLKLYIDDKCVYSNHATDLEPEVLLGYLGILCRSVGIKDKLMGELDRDRRPFSEVKSMVNRNIEWGEPIDPDPSDLEPGEFDPDRY